MTGAPGDLAGQGALVTGAAALHGIGRAAAEELAAQGATVLLTDRAGDGRENGLRAGVAAIEAAGGQADWHVLDITDADQIAEVMAVMADRFPGLHILVNNAGSLAGSAPFLTTTPEDCQISFDVNLLGPMRMTQAAIPLMRAAGGGAIINIGSTGSMGAEPGFGAYTTMKHGLVGLSNTIAAEFGGDGIRCNTLCPGFIDTDMHAAANTRLAAEQGVSVAEIRAERYAPVALRRAGTPQEVACAVAFLAGPGGAYITGASLPVAGGVPMGI